MIGGWLGTFANSGGGVGEARLLSSIVGIIPTRSDRDHGLVA